MSFGGDVSSSGLAEAERLNLAIWLRFGGMLNAWDLRGDSAAAARKQRTDFMVDVLNEKECDDFITCDWYQRQHNQILYKVTFDG